MTSGKPLLARYGHWKRQADGSYVSTHEKYQGMRIVQLADRTGWELQQESMEPVKRPTLAEAIKYAYNEANWIAPSVREYI
jgi:hypothetical protein